MNIKELKSKKLYKEYSLEIPYENIDKEVNKKISDLIPTISIPGFRKGKAPISIVKTKYEDSVLNEVIQKIISTKTNDLIKNKKLNLFRQPKIDLKKFEKNQPVELQIRIDLQPEVKLKDFKKIQLNNYEINLSKKNLEDQYKKFLDSQKSYKKIIKNRFIKENDRVIINFSTADKNVPEYLKSQKNMPVDTEFKQEVLPGLNKLLIGNLKEGEKKNISIDLSKVLKNDGLNKVKYDIEIISIEEKVKFQITDDYLKSNGFKKESDLKDFLQKNTIERFKEGLKKLKRNN